MGHPVAASIITADDAANMGDKSRKQHRVVGGATVYEMLCRQGRKDCILGRYRAGVTQAAVLATAHDGVTTGFLYGFMPGEVSGISARLRRLAVSSQHSSAATTTSSAPRFLLSRFTFTGSLSGTTAVIPGRVDEADNREPKLTLRSVFAGPVVTLAGSLAAGAIMSALSLSVSEGEFSSPHIELVGPHWDTWPVFAPGEGFVVWQDVNGTASETRKVNIFAEWDEIDTA